MQQFIDDESGYLIWLSRHPNGYVVNAERVPRPNYLILHRATCGTISGMPARGRFWSCDYSKTCNTSLEELAMWARQGVGGEATACGQCHP
ncbi:MAG: hypothetical protein ACRDJH_13985 [Thermomicrobiales bacterium]